MLLGVFCDVMDMGALFRRLCQVRTRRMMMIISVAIIVITVSWTSELLKGRMLSFSPADNGLVVSVLSNATVENNSRPSKIIAVDVAAKDNFPNNVEGGEVEHDMEGGDTDYNVAFEDVETGDSNLKLNFGKKIVLAYVTSTNISDSSTHAKAGGNGHGHGHLELVEKIDRMEANIGSTFGGLQQNGIAPDIVSGISSETVKTLYTNSTRLDLYSHTNVPSVENVAQTLETQPKNTELMHTATVTSSENSTTFGLSSLKSLEKQPTSISQMNSVLLQNLLSAYHLKPRRSSARDRELLSAKLAIENAHVIRDIPGLLATAFRNISTFKRSYELMERILKVYIYKEGEKPIFHQSKMRGIYASEGWFMKLMEGNRKFVVRDPRKAHLFYLPVSTYMLRTELFDKSSQGKKSLEEYLKNYVNLIAQRYSFWNRTGGADHFVVGCHDWASQLTRNHMSKCIRVLCNADFGKGFKIGKDTTLPATYIRSAENPLRDVGGKPPSERSILAFFAGGIHGNLRPILLRYWENKELDMKIFGPMPRDVDGKQIYREYMKSSKFCICPRGYEAYTPRVVEAIFYECVPVIISDNYVPPFFEVLNWESFSVIVQEKDVPNLRNILLSIPEKKYLSMQLSVRMVQQHFLWHKKPVKYDLFHMILHSVWRNRVFQMKTK